METWPDIAIGNLRAAGDLIRLGQYRSSISRAYYAVFAAATHRLSEAKVNFPKGWAAPHHDQLPDLIKDHLRKLPQDACYRVPNLIRRLYFARLGADYHPERAFKNHDARAVLMDARTALKYLGIDL